MSDLTTLAAVKQYLYIKGTDVDALIGRLISRESRLIERWTGRIFPTIVQTGKRLNGTGTTMLMLPDQPIIGVDSLSIDDVDVPAAASDQGTGYLFDDTTVYLASGQRFPMGRQNVVCSWRAGYTSTLTTTVPDAGGNAPTLDLLDPGSAVSVSAVTRTDGSAFALATANAPAAGQYAFTAPTITFSAADANTPVSIAFAFVPQAIEQACIEMVGLDLKQRDNLGIKSKTLANETISYEGGGLTQSVKEMLQPYKKVAPV